MSSLLPWLVCAEALEAPATIPAAAADLAATAGEIAGAEAAFGVTLPVPAVATEIKALLVALNVLGSYLLLQIIVLLHRCMQTECIAEATQPPNHSAAKFSHAMWAPVLLS